MSISIRSVDVLFVKPLTTFISCMPDCLKARWDIRVTCGTGVKLLSPTWEILVQATHGIVVWFILYYVYIRIGHKIQERIINKTLSLHLFSRSWTRISWVRDKTLRPAPQVTHINHSAHAPTALSCTASDCKVQLIFAAYFAGQPWKLKSHLLLAFS